MSEIFSFTYNGKTLSMPADTIDIDLLVNFPREAVRGWFAIAKDDIEKAMQERFSYYLSQPAPDTVSLNCINYSPDSSSKIANQFAKTGRKKNLLDGTIYVSTRYHVSCHELLFGTRYPVELFGQTKSFVQFITLVQDDICLETIRCCLANSVLKTDSPMYILRERCIEAGTAQGMNYEEIQSMIFGSPSQKQVIDQIYASDFPYQTQKQDTSVASHSFGLSMIFRDCRKYRVSADYLVLQDYSDFAVLDGQPLTAEQKEWLSLFLCATSYAQLTAIAALTKYRMIDGQKSARSANNN